MTGHGAPHALLTLVAVLALAGVATAQTPVDTPAPTSGPEPLWVPDPEQTAIAPGEPAWSDVPAAVDTATATAAAVPAADPVRLALAQWMAGAARAAGLPGELPVMAALVESGLRNLSYGDADSVGFFQMRLGVWNAGLYEGYLGRPDAQLRWFIDHALAVRDARRAAGDTTYGDDPATWGDWIAAVERPDARYRDRYALMLDEARGLLALAPAAMSPFHAGDSAAVPPPFASDPAAVALAQRVLEDPAITLNERSASDLVAGRIDPRLTAVLLEAAARAPIAISVFQTGHSYLTVNGSVSNHAFGRAVDIAAVGGAPVGPGNAAARELALALGELPAQIRPTEIGSPWSIDDPAYFTDAGHQDHLHVGFDDPLGVSVAVAADESATDATTATAAQAAALTASQVAVPGVHVSVSAEPRFQAAGHAPAATGEGDDPRFEAAR